jgi:putative transposase
VHQKRILRLMREHQRLVSPNLRRQAQLTPMRSQPNPTRPDEWWGIARTKVLVQGVGWGYSVMVLEWYTKAIVGDHAGLCGTTPHGLLAFAMAVNRQCPEGARAKACR